MNRFFCALALGLVVLGVFLLAASMATADTVTYTANFDSDCEGWDTVNTAAFWGSTGGQDGGGYVRATRTSYAPYLLPPKSSILYGDLPSNFGSNEITFSYYLKELNDTVETGGANLLMFANADADIWQWTPSDQSTADHVAPVHMDRGYHGLDRSSRLDADKRLGQLGQ